jgi:hypothetical protein
MLIDWVFGKGAKEGKIRMSGVVKVAFKTTKLVRGK